MNILWILEDALRPDHMGCGGYGKDTTPNCDRLAREGVRFATAIATATHTLPPIISMIMGQTPATHGVVDPQSFLRWKGRRPAKNVTTPLHILADRGYLIDGELVMRWQPLGFTRDTPSDRIEDYFQANRGGKWFFYAEPYPTHLPYNPPEEYLEMFLQPGYTPGAETLERVKVVRSNLIVHPSGVISKLEAGETDPLPDDDTDDAHKRTVGTVDLQAVDRPMVEALYDGEARVFDDLVGRWVARLESLGILDDTLIVLTADHGEELMERGHVGHCSCNLKGTLYDEALRVPLILRYPRKLPQGKVVARQVSQIDIMPTLLDLLGIPVPGWMDGASTLPLILGRSDVFRQEAYAQTPPAGWQALAGDRRNIWCVRTRQWKLILHTDPALNRKQYELYDLHTDPGETTNVFHPDHPAGRDLTKKLDAYIARAAEHSLT